MALTAYLAATNRLLQNPVPSTPLYTTADLTSYINEARQQLAGDAECIRSYASANLTASQPIYPFSLFTTFPAGAASGTITFSANPSPGDTITLNGVLWTFVASGAVGNQTNIGGTAGFTIATLANNLTASANASLIIAGYVQTSTLVLTITYKTVGAAGDTYTLAASVATVSGATLTGGSLAGVSTPLTIRQLAVASGGGAYKQITSRPWPWFFRYCIANGSVIAAGTPRTWSQQGLGSKGTFGVSPSPSSGLAVQADVVCLPVNLIDDTTAEAIPYPFTDAIPYYAAYKAYLSSQRRDDATVMLGRYKEFVKRATEETTPTVLPMNYQGGRGAQIAASKQSLTEAPGKQGGAQ